ncbi:MAG TPA: iron-sulfur cluster repair di-iron protein [Acidimicrobiales bacterium]|nr:iron-sulfur cluster repair di-iron protein [Acidimicrobiales bacterium]
MTLIDDTMTLAALVSTHPELARELERWGLDYCCRGNRTLADACAATGLDESTIVAELSAVTNQHQAREEWTTMSAVDLVDHIVATHHVFLWDELPRLTALLAKVTLAHGRNHPELRQVVETFDDLRAELEPHMLKEERVLFPMVKQLATASTPPAFHCGSVRNPISVMLREHDQAGALLARLRIETQEYAPPEDSCASYEACYRALAELEADTHLHIHKENNLLFPMVVRMEAALSSTDY